MSIARLRTFVGEMTDLVEAGLHEAQMFEQIQPRLRVLLEHDDWLPNAFAVPHPDYYQQYLLHCDPRERFSIVSFVWGPGQKTPVHDHTVWGLIGMLRGAETGTRFDGGAPGEPLREGSTERLDVGDIDLVSPRVGDVHQVRNAYDDRTSISIHVYGANIGAVRRHVLDPLTGAAKDFVSGFSSPVVPNLWSLA